MAQRSNTNRPALALVALATLLTLAAPTSALAAPTAIFGNGTLLVIGEAADETMTITQQDTRVQVVGPFGMNDPDGAGTSCLTIVAGSIVSCVDAAVDRVVVEGRGGNDTLQDNRDMSSDADALVGGAGDDTLTGPVGGLNPLLLDGGEGDDRLIRNRVAESGLTVRGRDGHDTLAAGTAGTLGSTDHGDFGNDTYDGSSSKSDVFLDDPGADTYNGGTCTPAPGQDCLFTESDTVLYQTRALPLVVTLDGNANDGAAGEGDNVMPDIERVDGGPGDDRITAGAHPAVLVGSAGDDRLVGSQHDDHLFGSTGSDALIASGGNDTLDDGDETPTVQDPTLPAAGNDHLDGGPGDDVFNSDRGADQLIGGAGYDRAFFRRVIPVAPTVPPPAPPAPFEISLDDGANDGQRGAGEGDNVHSDIEEIHTDNGDDVLIGSPGPDVLYSASGNDRIDPRGGADSVFAGGGDDGVSAVDQTTDHIDCEGGVDSVEVDLPGAQPERADVTFGCEVITGVPFGPLNARAGADTTPPAITNLRARRRRFAVGRRNTARIAATAKRGTTFTFALSENARVTITIARKLAGRRQGGRCLKPRTRSGPKCTRLAKAATLVRAHSSAGLNRVAYSGRVNGRALRPGRYRATVHAVDPAGNRATPRSLELTVVTPRG